MEIASELGLDRRARSVPSRRRAVLDLAGSKVRQRRSVAVATRPVCSTSIAVTSVSVYFRKTPAALRCDTMSFVIARP